MKHHLLSVQHLRIDFTARSAPFGPKKLIHAVDSVSFELEKNETLGIVGESGSGKSSLGRAVVGLQKPTSGSVLFGGNDRYARIKTEQSVRKTAQIVFQDPYASLNPRKTIVRAIGDPLEYNGLCRNPAERRQRVRELLALVGLSDDALDRYPHEFSGGQLQRACIAKALALESELIVCDEAVSALDAIHRRNILDLLVRLKETLGISYLFISHDLAAVRETSDRIAVMHLGSFVEVATAGGLCDSPLHPYTRALLASIPLPDPEMERARTPLLLIGDPPSPLDAPSGCSFRTRCPNACERCQTEKPKQREIEDGHWVACHLIN
jgi:oligopeptide transport system ATP-binding protein